MLDLLMQATGCSFRKAILQLEDFAEDKPARLEKAPPKEAVTFTLEHVGVVPLSGSHEIFRERRYGWQCWTPENYVYPVAGGFAFIYGEPDLIYGVKYRYFDGLKMSKPGSKFTHLWRAKTGEGVAVVCEGETDALAMAHYVQDGWASTAVYSLPAGAGKWDDAWTEHLYQYNKVWICMDNDHAGKQALEKIHRAMAWRGYTLVVPGLYNDAEEALRNGWAPKLG